MPTRIPQAQTDALRVLANPASYAARPSLIRLAQLVALSAHSLTPRQSAPRIGGAA